MKRKPLLEIIEALDGDEKNPNVMRDRLRDQAKQLTKFITEVTELICDTDNPLNFSSWSEVLSITADEFEGAAADFVFFCEECSEMKVIEELEDLNYCLQCKERDDDKEESDRVNAQFRGEEYDGDN